MRERSCFLERPWRQFSLAILIGALLGLLGPFGSYARLPIEQRLVHWIALVAVNWGLVIVVGQGLGRFNWGRGLSRSRGAVLAALAAAVPGGVATHSLIAAFGWLPAAGTTSLVEVYFYVAVIDVAVAVPVTLLLAPRHAPASGVAADSTPRAPSDPAFLRRIKPELGRELLAVSAEDHYLRIHTPLGSDLVLMRMVDAEAELAGIEGMRVHRSWWVAREAVQAAERLGQGGRLILRGGLGVPVSRAKVAALKQAGWF